MSIPWNIIIPGAVEITKEVIGLFSSRKRGPGRRRHMRKFISDSFPDIKENVGNILVELAVYAYKQGLTEEEIGNFLRDLLEFVENWLNTRNSNEGQPEE